MFGSRRDFLGAALLLCSLFPINICNAQNLTRFTPDVVLECRDTTTNALRYNCEFTCFALGASQIAQPPAPLAVTPAPLPPTSSPPPSNPPRPGRPSPLPPIVIDPQHVTQSTVSYPPGGKLVWQFERLEFFSKVGHNSENWLLVLKGLEGSYTAPPPTQVVPPPPIGTPPPVQSPPTPPVLQKIFITLGRSYMCAYELKIGSTVDMIKYY